MMQTLFSHPPSPFPGNFATATVVAFVLLRSYRFNFHCYTQRKATPTQKSARKWRCDLSQLLAQKITKDIHSCKPASLNCPKVWPVTLWPGHVVRIWLRSGLLYLHLRSRPDLNQKSDVFTAPHSSSVCHTFRPQLCAPDSKWCSMSGGLHPRAKLSMVRIRPSVAECNCHIPCPAKASAWTCSLM